MYKAYKFRLYPNDEQMVLINKTFGSARYTYNYYLDKMINNGYKTPCANIQDYVDNLKYEATFLQEIDSIVIRQSLFNLDNAYQKMFNKQGGYPKFKSKYEKNSYNTVAVYGKYKDKEYCNIELNLQTRQIKLPKLKWVDIRGYRNTFSINGIIKNATISKEQTGKYYVSILYEIPDIDIIIGSRTIVGIDIGIKKLLTLSDGTTIDNNKYIEKYQKRIKRKQRELSRKVKGSNNYYKCKKELAILYSKLANSRKYYVHKITKNITDEYGIITCEKLKTKEMIINGKENQLSTKINDATFSEIIRQLSYKAKFKGKKFYQINNYYPSSQICSKCDNQDKKYKNLNERRYKCIKCGQELDRDFNVSINIMFEGIKLYMENYKKNYAIV